MNIYTQSANGWVDPLRNFALGVSIASLFLAPATGYPIPLVELQPAQGEIDVVGTLPDGFADVRTLYYRTPFGLETPILPENPPRANEIERDSIPHILREMSGLSLEILASLAHVSRNAYYKWLDGKGVSDEHANRLVELLDTFRTISDLRGSNLKEFLETPDPAGKPIDLLIADQNGIVIGLALRSSTEHVETDRVSQAARDISGLPGWVKPAVTLDWGAPRSSASELDRTLDWLSPRAISNQVEALRDTDKDIDEHGDAFVAWSLVLE